MKKIALALTLVLATGYISNAVYAATSTNYTVFQDGKKKSSKKSCSSEAAKKSCSGEQTQQKACCSHDKK